MENLAMRRLPSAHALDLHGSGPSVTITDVMDTQAEVMQVGRKCSSRFRVSGTGKEGMDGAKRWDEARLFNLRDYLQWVHQNESFKGCSGADAYK